MPLQPLLVAEAQARIAPLPPTRTPAPSSSSTTSSARSSGSMNQVKSVRSVIEELVQEYADTMEQLDELAEK